MPNYRQYRYLHKSDNEWLSEPPEDTDLQEEWEEAWGLIKKEWAHKVEFTEDMYTNSEYADIPEFLNVEIGDDMVLQYKMARGVIKAIEGANSISFSRGFEVDVSKEWGGIGSTSLAISDTGAWLTITAKHSSDEMEVDVSEQFNQAIGETP